MVVYEAFSHPELRRYKTHIFSKATLLQIAIAFLTFIPPLFVVHRSRGYWLKEAYYREQPKITFKRELLLVLQLKDEKYLTYSTMENYNLLQQEFLRIPLIKTREEDENRDGKFDRVYFTLEMPLFNSEHVVGVQLLLIFSFSLEPFCAAIKKFSTFSMESMAYLEHSSSVVGAECQVFGDLRAKQKQPLRHKGLDTRYNISVINTASVFAESYEFSTIFQKYTQRNVTTELTSPYYVWITGRGTDKPFILSATINYPEQVYLYTPGFWYLIKWGWIQYVCVLLIFLFVFDRIKIFIYQNQLVPTMIEKPFKTHKCL